MSIKIFFSYLFLLSQLLSHSTFANRLIDLNGIVQIDWYTGGLSSNTEIESLNGFSTTLKALKAFAYNTEVKVRLQKLTQETHCDFKLNIKLAAFKEDRVPVYQYHPELEKSLQSDLTYHIRYESQWDMSGYYTPTARSQNFSYLLQPDRFWVIPENFLLETINLNDGLEAFLNGALALNPKCDVPHSKVNLPIEKIVSSKKPCSQIKQEKLESLLITDPELSAMKSEINKRKNYHAFGPSEEKIRKYINEVRKTKTCPLTLDAIDDMKKSALSKFKAGEARNFKMTLFEPINGIKPFYCGYNAYHQWIKGINFYDAKRNAIVERKIFDDSASTQYLKSPVKNEPGILWEHADSEGRHSYREMKKYPSLPMYYGDDVYFEIEPGVFLSACGWINHPQFKKEGFFSVEFDFTPRFFEENNELTFKFETISNFELKNRLEARKKELARMIQESPCEDLN